MLAMSWVCPDPIRRASEFASVPRSLRNKGFLCLLDGGAMWAFLQLVTRREPEVGWPLGGAIS